MVLADCGRSAGNCVSVQRLDARLLDRHGKNLEKREASSRENDLVHTPAC